MFGLSGGKYIPFARPSMKGDSSSKLKKSRNENFEYFMIFFDYFYEKISLICRKAL